jgi:acetyl-CoA carboxylase biotin carboxyl carrier protein
MADLGFELEEIARLIKLVEQRGLSELVVEEADRRVVIRGVGYQRKQATVAAPTSAASSAPAVYAESIVLPVYEAPVVEERVAVVSPMVGVFYRSPSPDAAPYVEVGDHVEVAQTIGMIEAMKVFSEVPSEHAGRVAEVAAENGQLVKTNEPILYLIPD